MPNGKLKNIPPIWETFKVPTKNWKMEGPGNQGLGKICQRNCKVNLLPPKLNGLREWVICILRVPSGEMRYILGECMATIGTIGNEDFANMVIGKAGRNRHRGIRPQQEVLL